MAISFFFRLGSIKVKVRASYKYKKNKTVNIGQKIKWVKEPKTFVHND